MTYYCRTCPRIIEEDTLDLCPTCQAASCLACGGTGVSDMGTDFNPEPPCPKCDGQGIDEDRQAEIRSMPTVPQSEPSA